MQILNVGDRCGEAHPGDEKTTPSVWFRRKDGQPSEWMVAFPSKELVGVFSMGEATFLANVDTSAWAPVP